MNSPLRNTSRWSTATRATIAATPPSELGALRDHLESCTAPRGTLHAVRGAMQVVRDALSVRIFTTIGTAILLILVASTLL